MAGNIRLPHICPRCGVMAKTAQELQEKFGYRNTPQNSATNQSWCRKCRNS